MGKLDDIEKRIKQLQEQKKSILAKESSKERKERTREHIIVGAVIHRDYQHLLPEILEKVSARDRTFLLERFKKNGLNFSSPKTDDGSLFNLQES